MKNPLVNTDPSNFHDLVDKLRYERKIVGSSVIYNAKNVIVSFFFTMFNERFKNALVDLKGAYHFFETTEHLNVHLYYCDENTKKNNPLYASFISAEDIFFYNLTNDIKHNVDRLIMKRHEDYNTMIDEFVRTDKCVMEYSLQLYKKMYILHEKKDITKIPLYE